MSLRQLWAVLKYNQLKIIEFFHLINLLYINLIAFTMALYTLNNVSFTGFIYTTNRYILRSVVTRVISIQAALCNVLWGRRKTIKHTCILTSYKIEVAFIIGRVPNVYVPGQYTSMFVHMDGDSNHNLIVTHHANGWWPEVNVGQHWN